MSNWSMEELSTKLKDNPGLSVVTTVPTTSKSARVKVVSGVSSKYHNQPTVYDGVRYASKAEARQAQELDLRKNAREIDFWLRQVSFPLPGGVIYRADFVAFRPVFSAETDVVFWNIEVIEVKGYPTPEWKRKEKLFRKAYPNLTLKVVNGYTK